MILEYRLYPEVPRYETNPTLSGTTLRFRFDWSGREDRWYLSIFDADGEPIRTGIKCMTNRDVLEGVKHANRPPGRLAFGDANNSEPAGFAELGRRVRLFYDDGTV